ncbi:MAG: MFS transporter [Gammaproteobacteria bacterium]
MLRPLMHIVMPWFYGWNILGICLVFQALTLGVVFSTFTFWAKPWMEEFDVTRATVMTAMMLQQLVSGVLAPFVGRAFDRGSIRAIVSLGPVLLAVGLTLIGYASTFVQIIAVYALVLPFATTLTGVLAAQVLAAKWFANKPGFAIGIVAVGSNVGGMIVPLLATLLLDHFDWRTAHFALAAFCLLVAAPLIWLVVRNPPPAAARTVVAGPAPADTEWTTRRILTTPVFWIMLLGFVPPMFAIAGFQFNLAPYTHDLGIDPKRAAVLFSIFSVAGIIGKLAYGVLADRINHRWLAMVGVATVALPFVMLSWRPDFEGLVLCCLVMGWSLGGLLPLAGAIAAQQFGPQAIGRVMGLFFLGIRPTALASPLAGLIRDRTGSYDPYLIGSAFVILLATAAFYWLTVPGDRRAGISAAPG